MLIVSRLEPVNTPSHLSKPSDTVCKAHRRIFYILISSALYSGLRKLPCKTFMMGKHLTCFVSQPGSITCEWVKTTVMAILHPRWWSGWARSGRCGSQSDPPPTRGWRSKPGAPAPCSGVKKTATGGVCPTQAPAERTAGNGTVLRSLIRTLIEGCCGPHPPKSRNHLKQKAFLTIQTDKSYKRSENNSCLW